VSSAHLRLAAMAASELVSFFFWQHLENSVGMLEQPALPLMIPHEYLGLSTFEG